MQKPLRICVIGGGASGLAVLKVLLESSEAQNGEWELEAFEARSDLGGVWFPSPPSGCPPDSPMYDALTTNLPHPVMAYQSFWFEPSTPLFPGKDVVLHYIHQYAEHFNLRKHYRFNSKVERAIWKENAWHVSTSGGQTKRFDKVIACNGHYREPRYPKIPGLKGWIESGRASHSVYFRNEQPYVGKTVLVIGNGPSGQDICAEVGPAAKLIYHSMTGGTPQDVGHIRHRGRVVELKTDGTALFDDGGPPSTVIDHAILATGYTMSFLFLPQIIDQPAIPQVLPLPGHLHNTTYSVFPLARHIFPIQSAFPPTSLAFVGLLIRVVPLPLFEAQARYISRVFQNPELVNLPKETNAILARYNQLQERFNGDAMLVTRNWHILPNDEQFSYRREILNLINASPEYYPEDWVEGVYSEKKKLRAIWRKLEQEGEAEEWVKNVGEGGRYEWVEMMRRLLASHQGLVPPSD